MIVVISEEVVGMPVVTKVVGGDVVISAVVDEMVVAMNDVGKLVRVPQLVSEKRTRVMKTQRYRLFIKQTPFIFSSNILIIRRVFLKYNGTKTNINHFGHLFISVPKKTRS